VIDQLPPPLWTHLVPEPTCICAEIYADRINWVHKTWVDVVGGVYHHPTCDCSAEGWVVMPPDEPFRWPRVHANRPQARDALEAVLCAFGLHHRCAEIELLAVNKGGEHTVFRLGPHSDPWVVVSMSRFRRMFG
jgi:hypothetical protein